MYNLMSNIIVTLTTTSYRINQVHKTILSILTQEIDLPFSVKLYISKEPYLLDKGVNIVPLELRKLLRNYPNFKIYFTKNIGSYRKLIPILKETIDKDYILITIDDDKIYKNNTLQKMLDKYYQYDGKFIIANRSFLLINDYLLNFVDENINSSGIKFLKNLSKRKKASQNFLFKLGDEFPLVNKLSFFEGNDGVLYHTSFFNRVIFNERLINKLGKFHDDFWFKLCCLLNNVGVICINRFGKRQTTQLDGTQKTSLHHKVNRGTYDEDLSDMCECLLVK